VDVVKPDWGIPLMTDESRSAFLFGPQQRLDRLYWQEQLAGRGDPGTLPADRRRSAVQVDQRSLSVSMPAELTERIVALSKGSALLTLATVAAATSVCLLRYGGLESVAFGTASSGAEKPQLLPIVVGEAEATTFRSLLSLVRQRLSDAYSHQYFPLERIESAPDATEGGPPALFNVRVDVEGHGDPVGAQGNDLSLLVRADPAGFSLAMSYHPRMFTAETIRRFAGHLGAVLAVGLDGMDRPVAELELLSPGERAELMTAARGRPVRAQDETTVPELLAEQAIRTPDAVALVQEATEVSYRELMDSASGVAARLAEAGVTCGSAVGLCAERSIEAIIGITGILLAGAAYMPLDPGTPPDRLRTMVDAAGARHVLTDIDVSLGDDVLVMPLTSAPGAPVAALAQAPAAAPAYIMFTSGSTGVPKGIEMPHRALVNLLRWQHAESSGLGGSARTLVRSPLWFDVSFQEIFATVCFGGTAVIAPAGMERDPAALAALMADQRVGRAFFPFVGLQQLVTHCVRRKILLPELTELITSGEQLKAFPALTEFFRANTGCVLRNQYGPTETHVVTSFTLTGPPTRWPLLPPIGLPIDGAVVHIADHQLRPVPVGVVGELCVGGIALATGYRGDPALTGERFVSGAEHGLGDRIYRTGDLARRRADGAIEFLGRNDRQLKIRGHRVEPGEVEGALLRHPAVDQAVVVKREDGPGDGRLVAYVVPGASFGPEVNLREHLAVTLPSYAIPQVFALLDRLPVTRTGKVDTGALPVPEEVLAPVDGASTAPRNDREAALAAIWCRVLQVDQVGVFDHFLELGGDSIIATQAVASANDCGLSITMREFFTHPTIAEQAALLPDISARKPDRADDDRPAPLTPVQRWFTGLDLPVADYWSIAVLLMADVRLELDLVRRTMCRLAERHEALSSVFPPGAATSVRLPPAAAVSASEVVALEGVPFAETVTEHARRSHLRIRRGDGPLADATVIRGGCHGEDRLLLIIHHLAVDGISWRVLLEEFQAIYRELATGERASLPARSASYQAWALGLAAYATSDEAMKELGYWLEVPAADMPKLPTAGPGLEANSRRVEIALTRAETYLLLRDVPAKYHARIEEVLLAALFEGMRSWTGHRSLLVEFEGHGRESVLPELAITRTVGWFSTMYPVALRIAEQGEVTPAGILARVKEAMRAVPNRGIGYGVLRYLCDDPAVREALAARPQPQIRFNYLGRFDAQFDTTSMFTLAPEVTGPMVDQGGSRPMDLYFQGHVVDGQAHFLLEYSDESHQEAEMTGVLHHFGEWLRDVIDNRDRIGAAALRESDFPEVAWRGSDFETLLADLDGGIGRQ
jgi:amino acid adenylation domain-containing protein/non-ribosomal peptide synthase protein (TIGR01720 family)